MVNIRNKTKYLEHDNHVITQGPDNHVMISCDGKMVFHSQCPKSYNEKELIEIYNKYQRLQDLFNDTFDVYLENKAKQSR